LGDGTYTYLYGHERIAQNSTAAGKQYFLNDALGSVRRVTNTGGAPTLTRGYEPYGKVSSSSGAGITAYGFAGEWTDNTGLIHLRARYYASGVGRFVSKDPWRGDAGRPMSYNGWLYVYANPTNLTDPSGWCGGENETPCPPTTPTATATPRPPIVMRTPTAIVYSPCLDRPCPRPATKLKGDCWATDTTRTGQWYEPDTFEGWRVLRFKKTKRSFLFEMTDEVNTGLYPFCRQERKGRVSWFSDEGETKCSLCLTTLCP
jgi:RHS repeat-associated protein